MEIVSIKQKTLDGLAVGTSSLCLIHCLILPILIALLPSLAAFLVFPHEVHEVILLIAAPASTLATAIGYRRHRWPVPAFLIVPGICFLMLGALAAPPATMETCLTVGSALLLAVGHALNWQASRRTVRSFQNADLDMGSETLDEPTCTSGLPLRP